MNEFYIVATIIGLVVLIYWQARAEYWNFKARNSSVSKEKKEQLRVTLNNARVKSAIAFIVCIGNILLNVYLM